MELIDPGNGVVYEWSVWREVLLAGDLPELLDPPQDPIKPFPWNLKWIPLTEVGGGGHYCVDLDPAPGGRVGQIIYFYTAIGPIRIVATGFAEWLEQYAARLESGLYTLGPDLEMCGPKEPI
jgi:cell wall assembly regulator SMI1